MKNLIVLAMNDAAGGLLSGHNAGELSFLSVLLLDPPYHWRRSHCRVRSMLFSDQRIDQGMNMLSGDTQEEISPVNVAAYGYFCYWFLFFLKEWITSFETESKYT